MHESIANLIDDIAKLPADWHGAGSLNLRVLRAIAMFADSLGAIRRSVETGSGKSTLLFSHLSADHSVFAVDMGSSISQVRNSPLFRSDHVRFVEGPTQLTLPRHVFADKVQIVLIDGPHAYPFPDLEYYYFYPVVETGGLLIVDDIQIPSIGRMFEIIKADEMFDLIEVVDTTAFFRRTAVAPLDPTGDGWWLQGYNRAFFEQWVKQRSQTVESIRQESASGAWAVSKSALRRLAHVVPTPVKRLIPAYLKRKIWE